MVRTSKTSRTSRAITQVGIAMEKKKIGYILENIARTEVLIFWKV